ncbi:MAG: rubredoxin [Clostridia bacterium]|nr:rubredoxin [Clostridia bacterium]
MAYFDGVICGNEYDEEAEETKFEDLPEDWSCPLCGVGKENFKKEE